MKTPALRRVDSLWRASVQGGVPCLWCQEQGGGSEAAEAHFLIGRSEELEMEGLRLSDAWYQLDFQIGFESLTKHLNSYWKSAKGRSSLGLAIVRLLDLWRATLPTYDNSICWLIQERTQQESLTETFAEWVTTDRLDSNEQGQHLAWTSEKLGNSDISVQRVDIKLSAAPYTSTTAAGSLLLDCGILLSQLVINGSFLGTKECPAWHRKRSRILQWPLLAQGFKSFLSSLLSILIPIEHIKSSQERARASILLDWSVL